MTSSNGNIFPVTGHLCGEFTAPLHKGQRRKALMFSLICVWNNGCVNNHEACNLRRCRAHYDVTVMTQYDLWLTQSELVYTLYPVCWCRNKNCFICSTGLFTCTRIRWHLNGQDISKDIVGPLKWPNNYAKSPIDKNMEGKCFCNQQGLWLWRSLVRSYDICRYRQRSTNKLGNALGARQIGHHFPEDVFKCTSFNENIRISIKISLTFVPNGQLSNIQHWFR